MRPGIRSLSDRVPSLTGTVPAEREHTMHSERLEFTGSTGAELSGKLDLPEGTPRGFALFAHCFTCGKDVVAASRISRALTDFGIAVLRFDFTGLGGSDGDFTNTNFTSNVADLVRAADYLRRHHEAPQLLIGHSLGGAAVLAAAEQSFLSLDGADHLLTRRSDAEFVATTLAAWAGRYLDAPSASQVAVPTVPVDAGTVVVSESGVGRFGQRVKVGRHLFAADEPEPTGKDSGPSPYDLLLAGLGACTSMTLRMYADRKQWPLKNVTVSLRHARVHARDCDDCVTKSGHLDRIERTIQLVGDLDAEQRDRLREIADRCPVHRTLHGEVLVDTTVTTGSDHRELELRGTGTLTAAPA